MPITRVKDGKERQDEGNAKIYRDKVKGELWVRVDMGVGIGENRKKTSVIIADYSGHMGGGGAPGEEYREWVLVKVVRVKPSTMQRVKEQRERWAKAGQEKKVGKRKRDPNKYIGNRKKRYMLFEGEEENKIEDLF